jgi:hypothetical protein
VALRCSVQSWRRGRRGFGLESMEREHSESAGHQTALLETLSYGIRSENPYFFALVAETTPAGGVLYENLLERDS